VSRPEQVPPARLVPGKPGDRVRVAAGEGRRWAGRRLGALGRFGLRLAPALLAGGAILAVSLAAAVLAGGRPYRYSPSGQYLEAERTLRYLDAQQRMLELQLNQQQQLELEQQLLRRHIDELERLRLDTPWPRVPDRPLVDTLDQRWRPGSDAPD
jgi:hypothetical protein